MGDLKITDIPDWMFSNWSVALLQHSGYVVGQKWDFARAVEGMTINSKKDIALIINEGGVLFGRRSRPSWSIQAQLDQEYSENYPPGSSGLVPRVRGTFSKKKVYGYPIYVCLSPEEWRAIIAAIEIGAYDTAAEIRDSRATLQPR